MMIFRPAINLVRQYGLSFALINLAYFGFVCGGMAYGAWDREVNDAYKSEVRQQAADSLPAVFDAYHGGHVAKAIGLTFAINLLAGSFLFLTLPSFIVPFSGLLLGGVRALTWGYVVSPTFSAFNGAVLAYGLLVGLLVVLEGEGYVLAMLGSYVHGKSLLFPRSAGATTRWQGYKLGAKWSLQLYALVAAVLLVAAVYEVGMVVYLMPLVR
ncbi:MAG: hypothetical protein WD845_15590 [Pirellulales bacterium]